MTNETPNAFLMLGLHKLAAERGDGLIPELLALYAARQQIAASAPLAIDPTVREPLKAVEEISVQSAGNDNVIALLPYLLARKAR